MVQSDLSKYVTVFENITIKENLGFGNLNSQQTKKERNNACIMFFLTQVVPLETSPFWICRDET